MDELLTALAELEGASPTTVLATPEWALQDDLRKLHALAVKHCIQIDVDKVTVSPEAFQLLRKRGYDIKVARESNIVMAVTLYTASGVLVLYHNTNILHSFVDLHKPREYKRSWLGGLFSAR
nr:MAG: hypothetical protein [Bacteriophage sp.]